MSVGLSEFLSLAKTPEEREKMITTLINLDNIRDEDIDLSDIPEKKDFSGGWWGKSYFDAVGEHNRRIREQEAARVAFEPMEAAL